jgi:hypothetical protein
MTVTTPTGASILASKKYSPKEIEILRRSAAQWQGTALPDSVEDRLTLAVKKFMILRNKKGEVAGFGREGFVLTPKRWGLYTWREERRRQAHINESILQES